MAIQGDSSNALSWTFGTFLNYFFYIIDSAMMNILVG